MKCLFFDYRAEFVDVLSTKLGSEFTVKRGCHDERDDLAGHDVLMVGIPAVEQPAFAAQLELLQELSRNSASVPVVALVAAGVRDLSLKVLSAGAYDYFAETGSLDELRIVLRRASHYHDLTRELERLRAAAAPAANFEAVLTGNGRMKAACRLAAKVAETDATVLITGESGTGKELIARAIHQASPRASEPFIALACSSLPEMLIEAELFGHEKGAFTGAVATRRGRFEAAERGTIFLDEIGDLPAPLQVKLLRVLQERTFERIGSNQPRKMEARVICATHRPLKELIKTGGFRADLYYRISTVEVELPPLRERTTDILLLAYSFLRQFAQRHNRPTLRISAAAMAALQDWSWPGNVRELQNVIERAVVVCESSEITISDLPPELSATLEQGHGASFDGEVRDFKRRLIERTLVLTGNNKVQAARSLKMPRSSLHRLIDELEIPAHQFGARTSDDRDDQELVESVDPDVPIAFRINHKVS